MTMVDWGADVCVHLFRALIDNSLYRCMTYSQTSEVSPDKVAGMISVIVFWPKFL